MEDQKQEQRALSFSRGEVSGKKAITASVEENDLTLSKIVGYRAVTEGNMRIECNP